MAKKEAEKRGPETPETATKPKGEQATKPAAETTDAPRGEKAVKAKVLRGGWSWGGRTMQPGDTVAASPAQIADWRAAGVVE